MPFTLSHPAAVLPLRRVLPFAALAIGSMAPDFPYFVALDQLRLQTHTWLGVLTFGVPVGLVAYGAFERWLRAAWCDLLPAPLAARVRRERARAPLLAVCAALALGAASHVAWDAFTHDHAPGVVLVNALNAVIVRVLGFPVRGYTLLQHGSTGLGLLALGLVLRAWVNATPPRGLPPSWERARPARAALPWALALVVLPASLACAASLFPAWRPGVLWISFVGATVVSGMSLGLAALCAYALWWRLRAAGRDATGARHGVGE